MWTKTPETTLKVLNLCSNLCESSLRASNETEDSNNTSVASQLSSARLTTQVMLLHTNDSFQIIELIRMSLSIYHFQGCIKAANDSEWIEQCNDQIVTLTEMLETIKTKLLNKA